MITMTEKREERDRAIAALEKMKKLEKELEQKGLLKKVEADKGYWIELNGEMPKDEPPKQTEQTPVKKGPGRPRSIQDLSGIKFFHLTVLEELGDGDVLCRCDCGKEKVLKRKYLLSKKVKSCGCKRRM